MTTYREAGVDIAAGDRASRIALEHARRTFGFRAGQTGQALRLDGVFTGLLDVGPFLLCLNSDGVGSKALVARAMERYDTLGYDLLAMVADDAVCAGAEPLALVNTLDTEAVDASQVDALMRGLAAACEQARVSVVGGEIAEMRDQMRGFSWSAALVGILQKDRVLGPHRVQPGDTVIGLRTDNFRANGFSLLRCVLHDAFGPDWHAHAYDATRTWGEVALAPCDLFTPFATRLTGGFSGIPHAEIHALAHITGGGLEGNTGRVIPEGCGVRWAALPDPPEAMARLVEIGRVGPEEARRTWNMGIGMTVISPFPEAVLDLAADMQVRAVEVGKVVAL